MDHQTAADSNAVERYTLDEMSADERDAFEEHYFDCRECAAGVRTAAKFADGVRTLPPIEQVPDRSGNQRANWWAAAAAIFAMALGLQTWMVVPRAIRTAPPAAAAHVVTVDDDPLQAASRGTPARVILVRPGEPVVVPLQITSELGSRPDIEVRAGSHTVARLGQQHVSESSYIHIELNVPPGDYMIVARGNGAVTEYSFTVRPR